MNKQVNHPYIYLAGILHIALVVNDVHEAMQAWSEWTGIEQSAMNLRLKGITGENKDPRDHFRDDYEYGTTEDYGFWEADVDLPNGLRIELIQPEPGKGPFREYYDKHGTGIHHIAFRCGEDSDALNDALEAAGYPYIVDTYHKNLDRWPVHDTESVMGTNLCIKPGQKNP